MSPQTTRLLLAVGENVLLPIGVYLALGAIGWAPVWALLGAAAVSVIVLAARYAKSRELTALGVLVLARFLLGAAVAVITGDARLELAKDSVITALVGLVAAGSLAFSQPLIARIRRDLAVDRHEFDRSWSTCSGFRGLHRRLTLMWTFGLLVDAVAAVVLIYSLPLTLAVVVTSVLRPAAIVALIGLTQYRAHRWTTAHEGSCAGCGCLTSGPPAQEARHQHAAGGNPE